PSRSRLRDPPASGSPPCAARSHPRGRESSAAALRPLTPRLWVGQAVSPAFFGSARLRQAKPPAPPGISSRLLTLRLDRRLLGIRNRHAPDLLELLQRRQFAQILQAELN